MSRKKTQGTGARCKVSPPSLAALFAGADHGLHVLSQRGHASKSLTSSYLDRG